MVESLAAIRADMVDEHASLGVDEGNQAGEHGIRDPGRGVGASITPTRAGAQATGPSSRFSRGVVPTTS
jgi:hypothetical protein